MLGTHALVTRASDSNLPVKLASELASELSIQVRIMMVENPKTTLTKNMHILVRHFGELQEIG